MTTKRYLVVYAKVLNSNFAGMSPDVLGCVSTGRDLRTIRTMMSEALTFHLEGLAHDGDAIPKPHVTSVDFSDEDSQGVEYLRVEYLDIPVPQAAAQHAVFAA